MRMIRATGAGLAMLAMVGTAAPAAAGDRDKRNHRKHHDNFDLGDAVATAVVAGGLLAIFGGKKKARAAEAPVDVAYEPVAGTALPVAIEEMTADDAADVCAAAAESQGAKMARIAQVGAVTGVDRSGERWMVGGTIQLRDSYRTTARTDRFRCTIGDRGVPEISISGDLAAT